jgi:hypothetical protein
LIQNPRVTTVRALFSLMQGNAASQPIEYWPGGTKA